MDGTAGQAQIKDKFLAQCFFRTSTIGRHVKTGLETKKSWLLSMCCLSGPSQQNKMTDLDKLQLKNL
jgi:hypothetical protein